jgi:hypothetical protein
VLNIRKLSGINPTNRIAGKKKWENPWKIFISKEKNDRPKNRGLWNGN